MKKSKSKKKWKNKRSNYYRELAGLRVVTMYVQEFFHWGCQQIDQQNDDGIDGYVIVRDRAGKDLGGNIRVQVKSGPGYFSSRSSDGKYVKIKPYASAKSLASHMEDYAKSLQPVILVWVNTRKKNGSTFYEDILNPEAWWERVDNYPDDYKGKTVITLNHKLGEHSKGDWFNTIKPLLKTWNHYPLIELDKDDKALYYSCNLKEDAHEFYKKWQQRRTRLFLSKEVVLEVKKTRTGWRHINCYDRGRVRTSNSLKMLSIAEKIMQTPNVYIAKLGKKKLSANGFIEKIGLRARVQVDSNTLLKVQVVLLRKTNQVKGIDECQFFSAHVIK